MSQTQLQTPQTFYNTTPDDPNPKPNPEESPNPDPNTDQKPPPEDPNSDNPETDKGPDFSRGFAALNKREKAITAKEREIKQFQSSDDYRAFQAFQKAKDNPLDLLKAGGHTFQSAADAAISQGETPTTDERVADLQRQLDANKKEQEEKETAAATTAEEQKIDDTIAMHKQDIRAHIDKDEGETFELIKANNAYDDIYEVISEWYIKSKEQTGKGQVLSIVDASQKVEDYLLDKMKTLLKCKKVEALTGQTATTETPPAPPNEAKSNLASPVPQTLSNNPAQVDPSEVNQADRPLTRDQRDAESKRRFADALSFT